MQLVRANRTQLTRIMEIIEDGRRALNKMGLNQWQDGYPSIEDIETDIEKQMSYVLIEEYTIIGTVALDPYGEPAYDKLFDGQWRFNTPYLTIHRMAMAEHAAAKGIGTQLLQHIEQIAIDKGISQIRLDTHEDNVIMQRVAIKNGYVCVGKVNYGVDFDCFAYDKKIEVLR